MKTIVYPGEKNPWTEKALKKCYKKYRVQLSPKNSSRRNTAKSKPHQPRSIWFLVLSIFITIQS